MYRLVSKIVLPMAALSLVVCRASSAVTDVKLGDIRVQLLNESLVRLEQKGPKGFEDRITFNVVDRKWSGSPYKLSTRANYQAIETKHYTVLVPKEAKSLSGVRIVSPIGALLYEFKQMPKPTFLPAPGQAFLSWVMPDAPRIVPPAWGAAPAKVVTKLNSTSGWDLDNQAEDVYVFINRGGGYNQLRTDFLKLTGPTPIPPLYLFGLIDSRWHAYTEEEALANIDEYRSRQIPLDVFVCDTDWRKNGSHGYDISEKHFPDMQRFFQKAHDRNVKIMFNDHPEPVSPRATDPEELQHRAKNLSRLLNMGLDLWWYDRNWGTHMGTPAQGLPLEVWGMRVYTDITQQTRPNQRPAVMTNAWGIDNGIRNGASYPAAHRYPIWWTGDTSSKWDFLKMGIENGVDMGTIALLPYVHEDLGGFGGTPTPELYVRFLQYGCLSPITRLHCGWGLDRHPWAYGEEANQIVTEYIKLRYRLLPTIYAAARKTYETGQPILRRCDLLWPTAKEAASSMQYMLGDDILVAPIYDSLENQFEILPKELLRTSQNDSGLDGSYFSNTELEGKPVLTRVDSKLQFNWSEKSPATVLPKENYSVRWTGTLGPVPETGEFTFVARADDGVRLYVNEQLIIDAWKPQDDVAQFGRINLEQGKTYNIRLEYVQYSGNALVQLGWRKPSESSPVINRSVWVPPGKWQDLWTGKVISGPTTIKVGSPLWHTPLYARLGGVVVLGPDVQYTSEKPWDKLTLEAYVPESNGKQTRSVYEDDTQSNAYTVGAFRQTAITLKRNGSKVNLIIDPAQGTFPKALSSRSWVVRFCLPKDEHLINLKLNGTLVEPNRLAPSNQSGISTVPLKGQGVNPAAEAGDVVEFVVPATSVNKAIRLELNLKHG